MAYFNVYLPYGEKLRIEADEYEVEGDQIIFRRDGENVNLYLNKNGVCIIPETTSLKKPDESQDDELDLFKSI